MIKVISKFVKSQLYHPVIKLFLDFIHSTKKLNKMKKIFLLSCCLLLSADIMASYSTDWIKTAGNNQKSGSMIARDKSNNLIVAGYITAQNMYTRKYDKFGNLLWEVSSTSGIPNLYEKPAWVKTDKNKNIYVVGYRYSWGSSWEYPNAVVVLKYNPDGALLWKKNIDLSYVVGSSTGKKFNLEGDLDNKGNLYIGTAGTTPAGFVLLKLNSSGTVLVNTSINLGTIHGFAGMKLKDNKVVVTGTAEYTSTLAIVAWDTTGTLLWSKLIVDGFSGQDVEMDGSGNVYVLTNYPNQVSPSSGSDVVIYKFNAAGVQTWKKGYDFGGYETATRFTLVASKLTVIGYVSINAAYFDWITFQTSNGGVKLWDVRYNGTTGNDEAPYDLVAKSSGEVFVTGKGGPEFTQPNGSSYLRMITLKYSNEGVQQWVDSLNIYSGWGIGCTLASDSSLFVLGGTNMTAIHLLDHTGIGSCEIPIGLNTSAIKDTSAKFSWTPVAGAYLYHLRYKTTTAADWTTVSTDQATIKIKTLAAGKTYNYAVEAVCSSGPSGYGEIKSFTTTGMGYCSTTGIDASVEYLSFVWIGGIQNVSASNNGYADFTNISTSLEQGATIYGYLSAALPYGLTENYCIWIDYNHDNDFTDAGEQVVNIASDFLGWIAVNFTVPANAAAGNTRMRITMKYGGEPAPCGSYDRGETEDYSVIITSPFAGRNISSSLLEPANSSVTVFPNPFMNYVSVVVPSAAVGHTLSIYDISGKLLSTYQLTDLNNELDLSALKGGIYFCMIKTNDSIQTVKLIKN